MTPAEMRDAGNVLERNGIDPMPRPWMIRAAELAEKSGCYADYEAWKEWINGELGKDEEIGDWFGEAGELVMCHLYGWFCRTLERYFDDIMEMLKEGR